MSNRNIQHEWCNWEGLLPSSHYIDNGIYLSEDILQQERSKVFGKVWAFLVHESEIPEPGDYVTTNLGGTPLVVLRDVEGVIRTFLNVCPHRGATLVTAPAGKARGFTCLFHQWSFDTMGKCRAVPNPEGFREIGLGTENFSLREFRTGQKLGLIFTTLDDDAEPLEDYLGGVFDNVDDVMAPYPLEVFHYHRIVIPTNWKLWAATNVELYHVWLHSLNRATSLKAPHWLERKPLSYSNGHLAFEPVKIAYDKAQLGSRDLILPGLGPNEARLMHVFPDLLVNIRSSSIRLDRVTPLSAGEVMVELRGLGIKGESEVDRNRRISEHNEFWGPMGRNLPEDALAAVLQMRAIRNGNQPHALCAREPGTTPAMSDEPLRHYYRKWSELMECSSSDSLKPVERLVPELPSVA